MEKNSTRSWWIFLIAFVFAGVLAGGVLGSWASRNGYPLFTSGVLTPTLASNTVPAAPAPTGPLPDSFAPIIQPDLPSVVYISTTTVVNRPTYNSPFFNNPFFRQFFGPQQGPSVPEKQHALGSGFIVRSDGLILTNNHVVRGATDIRVTLNDKREFKAKVLGTDPRTDLAVLKIDTTGLKPLPLGTSSQLRVGDLVFAIGDPFGVGETVTMGIISAKGRSNVSIEGPQSIQDFIQTDAAINPGNSGGPLINTRGQVVGIDTAIVTGGRSQGNIGIGFAIPIDLARNVMNQLIEHGKVIRGQLGVNISNVDPVMAKQFGLPKAEGVIVDSVEPDSAAAKAGIQRGDIILKFNGEPIASMNDLVLKVTQVPPGTKVSVEIFRDGKTLNLSPVLQQASASGKNEQSSNAGQGSALQGVRVQTLTPQIASQLNLPADTYGVVVAAVSPNSPAANALQRGDVIQEVNRKRVPNVTAYDRLVQQAGNQPILLLVNRGGQTIYISISPGGE